MALKRIRTVSTDSKKTVYILIKKAKLLNNVAITLTLKLKLL